MEGPRTKARSHKRFPGFHDEGRGIIRAIFHSNRRWHRRSSLNDPVDRVRRQALLRSGSGPREARQDGPREVPHGSHGASKAGLLPCLCLRPGKPPAEREPEDLQKRSSAAEETCAVVHGLPETPRAGGPVNLLVRRDQDKKQCGTVFIGKPAHVLEILEVQIPGPVQPRIAVRRIKEIPDSSRDLSGGSISTAPRETKSGL